MNIRSLRSFSAVVMKTAAEIKDPDIRQLLSERKGEEYLQGGRLLSNSAAEGAQYAIKLAAPNYGASRLASGLGGKTSKKKNNTYQKVRDYAVTGMRGGLTGLGVLGAANAIRHPSNALDAIKNMHHARKAVGIGAGVALADRAYRHDELSKKAFVEAKPGASFQSPANELANTQKTGKFEAGKIHAGAPIRPIRI